MIRSRIKELREDRDFTQREIAQLLQVPIATTKTETVKYHYPFW